MRIAITMVVATRTTLAVAVLAGCATPYQPRGLSGGYSEQSLGHGRWAIEFGGNSYTSQSTVTAYSHRRASELCPGGYDVVDANRDTSFHSASFDGGKTTNVYAKPGAALVVQCKGAAYTPQGHWCTSKPNGDGVCAPQPGLCEVFRGKMNEAVGAAEFGGCVPLKVAICASSGCFTTPAMCAEFERARKRDGSACVLR